MGDFNPRDYEVEYRATRGWWYNRIILDWIEPRKRWTFWAGRQEQKIAEAARRIEWNAADEMRYFMGKWQI